MWESLGVSVVGACELARTRRSENLLGGHLPCRLSWSSQSHRDADSLAVGGAEDWPGHLAAGCQSSLASARAALLLWKAGPAALGLLRGVSGGQPGLAPGPKAMLWPSAWQERLRQ